MILSCKQSLECIYDHFKYLKKNTILKSQDRTNLPLTTPTYDCIGRLNGNAAAHHSALKHL